MHVPIVRSLLVILGLCLGSGLSAQQEFPTYRELQEEQRIILNAYLIRGENPYLLQAKAQFTDNTLRSSKQNVMTAILLLARAKQRLNLHPTRIEQARNAIGFRLSEADREKLRKSVRDDIDPRFFRLQGALEEMGAKFKAKGDPSVENALRDAERGDVGGVEKKLRDEKLAVEQDTSGLKPLPGAGGGGGGSGGTGTGSNPGGNNTPGGNTGGGPSAMLPNGGSVAQTGPNTVTLTLPDGRTQSFPGTFDGRTITTPEGWKIDASTIRTDANGNIVAMSDRGPVYFKDGKWHLGVPPGSGGAGSGTSGSGTGPGGPGGAGTGGATLNGQVVDEGDLSDGVLRRYIGGRGVTLLSEQRISLAKNADGSPKLDSSGKMTLDPGERRVWAFRMNPGEQKTVDGRIQQTVAVVDGGGSTSFNITSWDVRSRDGRSASVQPGSNPGEAIITFPGNGTYDIVASGTTTGWEKGSPFKVRGEVGVAQ